MENFEKIVIGLFLFAATSIIAYLFRMRQLYVVVPKLFRHAQISKEGSLCELLVYNKGNQVEENIQVSLDPELRGELLATSSNDITLENSTLKIERLHKGTEASMVLLIENGVLDATRIISASSKGAKGRVLKKATELPPNYARAFLLVLAYLAILPMLHYGNKAYKQLKSGYVQSQLTACYKLGWRELDRYYDSDLRVSYSNQEFPIRFLRTVVSKDKIAVLEFELLNKTALPLKVSVDRNHPSRGDISNYASAEVQPMSTAILSVPRPGAKESGKPELSFNITFGDEFVHSLVYEVSAQ